MKIEKLGENLFKVRLPVFYKGWYPTKELSKALLEVQNSGKVVTSVQRTAALPETFLVCTTDKLGG